MPPYDPNPDDVAIPVLSTLAGTAQADFVALKQKVNNVFLLAGYNPVLKQQVINAGLNLDISIPASTSAAIAYGYAANITRNDLNGGSSLANVAAVAAQLNARLGDNLNAPFVKDTYVFGYASEAWTGEIASQATLIGGEMAIISQYNANQMAMLGNNIVFKNMSDVQKINVNHTHQGKGADKYNSNSIALFFSSFARSLDGERCGWGRGLVFTDSCFDEYWDNITGSFRRPVGIDFREQDGPFTSEPWTAYITPLKSGISSAICLAEYQSITWDRLQFIRTYLDSTNERFIILGIGASPTTVPVLAYNYDLNCLEFPSIALTGAPSPVSASIPVRVNGTDWFIGLSPA